MKIMTRNVADNTLLTCLKLIIETLEQGVKYTPN